MTLRSVTHDLAGSLWCGPAALSIISGCPTSKCSELLLEVRQRITPWKKAATVKGIKGVYPREVERVLESLGYRATRVFNSRWCDCEPTSVAKFLRERKGADATTFFLISAGHHLMVVKGRKFVDNKTRKPVWIRQAPSRRKRLEVVWRIERLNAKAC